jgi:hypothetical protein
LVIDINQFEIFTNEIYEKVDKMHDIKKNSENLLNGFVKIRGKDNKIVISRNNIGDKILVDEKGMHNIPFRYKNGKEMLYPEIFNTIVLLKDDKRFLKLLMKNPELKIRIECFIKAIMKIPELNNSMNEWEKFQKDCELVEFDKPFVIKRLNLKGIDDEEQREIKAMAIRIKNNIINLYDEKKSEYDDYSSDKVKLDNEELGNLYLLYQLMPIIRRQIENMANKIDEKMKDITEKSQAVKKDLAPILTLEAL